eukprot:jgi/Orpsp1_1/1192315/evm.model.d7180000092204.1
MTIPLNSNNGYSIFVNYTNNLIPGLNIKEKEKSKMAIIKLNISNNSVLQSTEEDGFIYDDKENKLYICKKNYYGSCEEIKIVPGYYFNYKDIEFVIKCESYSYCYNIDLSKKDNNNDNNSNSYSYIDFSNDDNNNSNSYSYIDFSNDDNNNSNSYSYIDFSNDDNNNSNSYSYIDFSNDDNNNSNSYSYIDFSNDDNNNSNSYSYIDSGNDDNNNSNSYSYIDFGKKDNNDINVIEDNNYDSYMDSNESIYECSNSNIIFNDNEVKICSDKDNNHSNSLEKIDINLIYAIRANLQNKFPGAKNRYALVNINRYYITFKKDILEISDCPSESINNGKNADKYCLKKDEKLYKYSNVFSPVNKYDEDLEINSKYEKSKIIYEYDTNNGFFIYNYCNDIYDDDDYNKSLLKKVYIDNGETKYECVIGSSCVEQKKADIPVIGYTVTDDGILRQTKHNVDDDEFIDDIVEEKIYESRYLMYQKNNTSITFIKCYIGGFCEKDNSNNEPIKYDSIKKNILVTVNGHEYESNKMKLKYIFGKYGNSSNHKRSVESEKN